MFGLFVNLKDRLAVVVGGGPVGRRKAQALLAAGARVRVVCLEPRPPDAGDERLEWLQESYESRHLAEAVLVFAAAPSEVNAQVVAAARAQGVWVCDATDPDNGDFVTPATVRRGNVVVAVTTGVPALTRALRERLEEFVDPEYEQWAAILAELRPRVLAEVPADHQAALWRELTGGEWLARLREAGTVAVRAEMEARLRSSAPSGCS
jgi:precorrin-2 dehydrogenase/sirohydrochlorin ferrochelatase